MPRRTDNLTEDDLAFREAKALDYASKRNVHLQHAENVLNGIGMGKAYSPELRSAVSAEASAHAHLASVYQAMFVALASDSVS